MSQVRDNAQIESIACQLRERFHIDRLQSPDMDSVLNKIPDIFPGFEVVRSTDAGLPQCEAKVEFAKKKLYIRETICREASLGDPRARMTIAHEIGHIALEQTNTRYRMIGVDKGAKYSRQIKRDESEAKRFAASFLAPIHLVVHCDSEDEIRDKFQLSDQAAQIRFEQAQAHKRKKTGQKRPLPQNVIDFLTEKKKRGYKITALDD